MNNPESGGIESHEGPLTTQEALDALQKLQDDGMGDSPMATALRAQVEGDLGDDWEKAA